MYFTYFSYSFKANTLGCVTYSLKGFVFKSTELNLSQKCRTPDSAVGYTRVSVWISWEIQCWL